MLVALTDGFERFTSVSELCNYARLTPLIRQRGHTVKRRPRISNIGNQKLGNLLLYLQIYSLQIRQGIQSCIKA
jgi:transposase